MATEVTVSCVNPACPSPPSEVQVSYTEVAPGILAAPHLICAACSMELWLHHGSRDVGALVNQ